MKGIADRRIAVVVLAAGGSRRLGQPKQLLHLSSGVTLLEHTILCAHDADLPVIVVTGAYRESVAAVAEKYGCTIVHNAFWEKGMASSVRSGIAAAEAMQVTHAILAVVDQPFLVPEIFRQLTRVSGGRPESIITCRYSENTSGPPTLFPAAMFHHLKRLTGDAGARSIVKEHSPLYVSFELGKADIDEAGDLILLDQA